MRVEAFALHADWRAAVAAAQRAEDVGFDYLASAEISNDPFLPLAAAALATERIGLRKAIAVAFPRSPMVLAATYADLERAIAARFGGLTDSLELGGFEDVPPGEARELLQDVRRIPARFAGPLTTWS